MANVIMGKDVAAKMRERMKENISRLNGVAPTLATIRVGDDYGSIMYEKGVVSQADKAGVTVSKYIFPGDISQEEFEKEGAPDKASQGLIHCKKRNRTEKRS